MSDTTRRSLRGVLEPHLPVIVIGASAGGVEALRRLAAELPGDLRAAIFAVLHVGAHRSELPWLLNQDSRLRAEHATDGAAVVAGRIYIAPPDRHLLLEHGRMRLTRGPAENWARPAVDPLFRSAAAAYGPNVIGVILTGGLNDGTAGLYEIARRGGVTVVQDPDDAVAPGMPASALRHVAVQHRLPLAEIAGRLTELSHAHAHAPVAAPIRAEESMTEYKHDAPVALTCPDCDGALRRKTLGSLVQFACHIGHVYTAEVMAAAQAADLERILQAALRALNERRELCGVSALAAQAQQDYAALDGWRTAEAEAASRFEAMREWLQTPWAAAEPG